MDLILDTSAFLSGRFTSLPTGFDSVFTTPEVIGEVNKGRPARSMDVLLDAGLKVIAPSSTEGAVESARRTGDLPSLSLADISIIALAMEHQAVVITDDFAIQNVLSSAGIRFEPAGELGARTISEKRTYTGRCRGCGRYFGTDLVGDDCPICGSPIGKARRRS